VKRIRRLLITALFTVGVALATATATAAPPAGATTSPDLSGIGMPQGLNHAGAGPLVSSTYYQRAVKSSKWAPTSGGLVFKSCVYHVPNGTEVDSVNNKLIMPNGTVQSVKACAYPRLATPQAAPTTTGAGTTAQPASNGYMQYFGQSGLPALGSLSVNYAGPTAPTAGTAEEDFTFSGLEPSDGSSILQPVVGWGSIYTGKNGTGTLNGSGDYVWMASYYYWGGNAVAGAFQYVDPSDTIQTSMTSSKCGASGAGCTWDIHMNDPNTTLQSDLVVYSSPAYHWLIGGAIESYYSAGCDELFANHHLVWRNMSVRTFTGSAVTPSFSKTVVDQECSMNTTYSSTSGDITWTP
jgi:hypothetical protein